MKILIMGLPGSGKTTLAQAMAEQLGAVHLNADVVRSQFNDWNFDIDSRERQARRMSDLAEVALKYNDYVVVDFVCPTEETRRLFNPDHIIWMDTIDRGRYEDTNRIFEEPKDYLYKITTWGDVRKQASMLIDGMLKLSQVKFDTKNPTALMIGRFQPFHDGHKKLFEKMLEKEGQVLIMIRDTYGDDKNPFDFIEVGERIKENLKEYEGKFQIMCGPNITGVYYGRDVGYKVEQIKLDEETENISATKIRKEMGL